MGPKSVVALVGVLVEEMNDEAFGVEFEIGEESNRLFFFQAVIHVLYLSKLQKTDSLKILFGGRL